jgi:hypothetical protein
MKLVKTASGNKGLEISKTEWLSIGKTSGWLGREQNNPVNAWQDSTEVRRYLDKYMEVNQVADLADLQQNHHHIIDQLSKKYGEKEFKEALQRQPALV